MPDKRDTRENRPHQPHIFHKTCNKTTSHLPSNETTRSKKPKVNYENPNISLLRSSPKGTDSCIDWLCKPTATMEESKSPDRKKQRSIAEEESFIENVETTTNNNNGDETLV